jgi:hypothetical protein
MNRRRAGLCIAAFAARPAWSQTSAAARAQARDREALLRFEEALHKEVAQARGTPAVGWREAIVPPDVDRLIWGERVTRVPGARPVYRAAFDPRTRWYYVTRTVGGNPPQYFGPIDEVGEGEYADVFAAQPAAAAR